MKNLHPFPALGAAYYPEAWDESEQERDIASMQEAGLKCVRIGEFAWHRMEPGEGAYDFAWLHRVIDKLAAAGIAVILGTPTATPPIWLLEKEPGMLRVNEHGFADSHGGRRHCCSNHELYRDYSAKIVEEMAKEFGADPNVVGWQIDNEINVRESGCFCPVCKEKFARYLEGRYGTVENLNRSWDLNLFSQWYDRFDQVPMPAPEHWHTPHLRYEWQRFQGESHVEYVKMQADILHRYTKVPVGTDMMPILKIDYEKIAEFCDVIQFNHYNDEKDLWWSLFWFDYMRTLKERPFWNTETSTCWNGGTQVPDNLRPEGFCRVNSWLPVALGAESNLYWLWRQHQAGHELMHGAVLYASGRPMHTFGEVQEVAAGFEKAGQFLRDTGVQTEVALMISSHCDNMMTWQHIASEPGFEGRIYTHRAACVHRVLSDYGLRPDVIGTGKALDGYKVLFTPYMMSLEMDGLPERIEEWVRAGGTWVVGPMADIRNSIGAHYTDREMGITERLTGAVLTDQVPDKEHRVACSWTDGTPFMAKNFLQLFKTDGETQVLAAVTGDYDAALTGKAIAFVKKVGEGHILVLGALPETQDLEKIAAKALELGGVMRPAVTGRGVVAKRQAISRSAEASLEGYTVVAYAGEPVTLELDGLYTDLLTDTVHMGRITVPPYQVSVLEKSR